MHRRWLLQELAPSRMSPLALQALATGELRVCTRLAQLYPRNYAAWTHRLLVARQLGAAAVAADVEHVRDAFPTDASARCYAQRLMVSP